jgi:DNA repair protein RadC
MRGDWLAMGAVAALAVAGAARRGSSNAPTAVDLRAAFARQAGSGNRAVRPTSVSETFLRMEPSDVPDDLLVAVLLSGTTGRRNAAEVAAELIGSARGDLAQVVHHLPHTRGVGERGRARLAAASELYRRANYRAMAGKGAPITSPEDAVEILRAMALGDAEQLVAVYLDRRHRVLATRRLSIGSDAFTVVDPRAVYRPAIQLGAAGVIMAHNHPSGDSSPSSQDKEVTRRVKEAGRVLGVPLLDHMVVVRGGDGGWTSLAELGYV